MSAMDPDQVDPVGLSGQDDEVAAGSESLDSEPAVPQPDGEAVGDGEGAGVAAEAAEEEDSDTDSDLAAAPTDTNSGSRDPDPVSDQTPDDDLPAPDVADSDAEPSVGKVPEQTASDEEIEADRQERLDPDNRPDGAEIDNTQRDFDETKGMFTDSEGYDEAEEKFPPMGEQGA